MRKDELVTDLIELPNGHPLTEHSTKHILTQLVVAVNSLNRVVSDNAAETRLSRKRAAVRAAWYTVAGGVASLVSFVAVLLSIRGHIL